MDPFLSQEVHSKRRKKKLFIAPHVSVCSKDLRVSTFKKFGVYHRLTFVTVNVHPGRFGITVCWLKRSLQVALCRGEKRRGYSMGKCITPHNTFTWQSTSWSYFLCSEHSHHVQGTWTVQIPTHSLLHWAQRNACRTLLLHLNLVFL